MAHPFFCVVDFSATRIERQSFAIEATDHIVIKLCAIFFVRRLKLGYGRRVRFVELLSHERALAEQPLCVTVNLMKLRRVARGCIEFFPEVRDVVFSRLAKRCACSKRLEKLAKRLAGQRFLSTLNQSQLGRRFELSISRSARASSSLTEPSAGVTTRDGAPRPPGMVASGPRAASTMNGRGAMSETNSASPNCSSKPNTFRSIGSCQMFCRESK